MKKHKEIIIALLLCIILFFKIDPFHWLMPTEVQMIILCLFFVAFALYTGIIFREKPHDERENYHLYKASRYGYLAGIISLSIVIIIQDLRHKLDASLVLVLVIMILVKLIVLKYSQYKD
jgi:cobalamin synthase